MHDWHYFFHHVPQNLENSTYHIFDPQWKAEILRWFGREDVVHEQKEEFIKALIDFDDGCGDFYRYRAYFLACEALAHFPDYSLGDAIIGQLLKWSYAYFRQEKRDWKIYPDSLVKTARTVLEATDRKRVIAAFVRIVHTTKSRSILRLAAERLGQLDPGNKVAIAALILLIQITQDESAIKNAIHTVEKIGYGNQRTVSEAKSKAIAALVDLMETTLNKNICYSAIAALRKIGYGNETAIAALVRFLEINWGDTICFEAAEALWQIAPGNEIAIIALSHILETHQCEWVRFRAAARLVQIDPENNTALLALAAIQMNRNLYSEDIDEVLRKFDTSNEAVIATLSQILETNHSEWRRPNAAKVLLQVDPDYKTRLSEAMSKAIATVVQILETTEYEWSRLTAAEILAQIDEYRKKAINTLLQLVNFVGYSQEYDLHLPAIFCLQRIDPTHQLALNALVHLIKTTRDRTTLTLAAKHLAQLDSDNKMTTAKRDAVVSSLVQFMQTFEHRDDNAAFPVEEWDSSESYLLDISDSLKEILQSDHLPQVVTVLKNYLDEQFYKHPSYRYEACYRLIWHCAQNMTYLEFYQAWHS